MAVKRSENYLYFQNKALHYQNVQTARSRIQDQLSGPLRRTLDHSQHIHNHDIPYSKNYEIEFENKRLANRILSISNRRKNMVEIEGSYCRFNKFQRNFRHKNPYKDEEQRQISLQNYKIKRHITASKARVGNTQEWQAQYNDKSHYKKIRSRYQDGATKGDLLIEKEPFLLDPYVKYIDQMLPSTSDKKLPFTEGEGKTRPRHVRIQKEKLFILPSYSAHDRVATDLPSKSQSRTSRLEEKYKL